MKSKLVFSWQSRGLSPCRFSFSFCFLLSKQVCIKLDYNMSPHFQQNNALSCATHQTSLVSHICFHTHFHICLSLYFDIISTRMTCLCQLSTASQSHKFPCKVLQRQHCSWRTLLHTSSPFLFWR